MRWLLRSVLLVILLVAGVYGVGSALPVEHVAARSAPLGAPPQQVYDTIADVGNYSQWWPQISRVELLPSEGGQIRFRQHTGAGPITMQVEEASPPSRFVTRIADPDQPFGGTWTFEIVPDRGTKSVLSITERGEVYNPFFRFMARFVFGYTQTMDDCLAALTAKFGA
jgi:uncharacterized protein YndB with AHSA1/START domain